MAKPELAQYYSEKDDDGRGYKHPFRLNEADKPLTSPSVTTILKGSPKDLSQWAADQAMLWAVENWELLSTRSDEEAFRIGRYRWNDVRNERAEVGTGVHETIEALHRGTWDFPLLNEEQEAMMVQWELLNEEFEIVPLRSEFTIWNFTHDYAGTADGLWWVTNRHTGERKLCVIDVKTSRRVWPENFMQLAALKNAEVIMEKIEDRWIELDPTALHGDWANVGVGVIHLRADHHDFVTVSPEEETIRYAQFINFREQWTVKKQVEALIKSEQSGAF